MTIECDNSTESDLHCKGSPGRPATSLFVERCGRAVYQWSLKWGATAQDADGLIQEILNRLLQKHDRYQVQDGARFRYWLKGVGYHCWLDLRQTFLRQPSLNPRGIGGASAAARIVSSLACSDLVEVFNRVADEEILNLAMNRIKEQVDELSWQCFEKFYLQQHSGPDVAASLEMEPSAVFLAVSCVRKAIRNEVVSINAPDRDDSGPQR